jgi:hypothetical protein
MPTCLTLLLVFVWLVSCHVFSNFVYSLRKMNMIRLIVLYGSFLWSLHFDLWLAAEFHTNSMYVYMNSELEIGIVNVLFLF